MHFRRTLASSLRAGRGCVPPAAPHCLGLRRWACQRLHVLFFSAAAVVRLLRDSEHLHPHPREGTGGVQPSIEGERLLLGDRRARADKVIDTTYLSVKDLRDTLHSLYGEGLSGMLVQLVSFGYKYGLPPSADLILDVRFMENPFYIH